MFAKLIEKINAINAVRNYRKIYPYIRPYWFRALLSILITIPIGSMDAVIAWSLKPYMDVVMVEKNINATNYIPILIIIFSILGIAIVELKFISFSRDCLISFSYLSFNTDIIYFSCLLIKNFARFFGISF